MPLIRCLNCGQENDYTNKECSNCGINFKQYFENLRKKREEEREPLRKIELGKKEDRKESVCPLCGSFNLSQGSCGACGHIFGVPESCWFCGKKVTDEEHFMKVTEYPPKKGKYHYPRGQSVKVPRCARCKKAHYISVMVGISFIPVVLYLLYHFGAHWIILRFSKFFANINPFLIYFVLLFDLIMLIILIGAIYWGFNVLNLKLFFRGVKWSLDARDHPVVKVAKYRVGTAWRCTKCGAFVDKANSVCSACGTEKSI